MTVTHTKFTHCITVNLFIAHIPQAETVFMKYWSKYDLHIRSTSVTLYIMAYGGSNIRCTYEKTTINFTHFRQFNMNNGHVLQHPGNICSTKLNLLQCPNQKYNSIKSYCHDFS